MGIDGSRLDPAEAAARGYSLTVGEVYVVLEIPLGAAGGHVKVSNRFNGHTFITRAKLRLCFAELRSG